MLKSDVGVGLGARVLGFMLKSGTAVSCGAHTLGYSPKFVQRLCCGVGMMTTPRIAIDGDRNMFPQRA